MLLDIKNPPKDEINDHLYDAVHNYAAIDFEVRKHVGGNAARGSTLEKLRKAHINLKKHLNDIECTVDMLPSPLHEIIYCLTLNGQNYKLDSKLINEIHRTLDVKVNGLLMKY